MQFNAPSVQRLSCDKITLLACAPAFSGADGLRYAENIFRDWTPFGSVPLISPHYPFGRSAYGIAVNWGKQTKLSERTLNNEFCDLSSRCLKKEITDTHVKTSFNLRIEFNPNKSSLALLRSFFEAAFPEQVSINFPIKITRYDSALDYHDPIDIRFIDSSSLRAGSIYFDHYSPETLYLGSSSSGSRLLRCYDKLKEQMARRNQWLSGTVLTESVAERYNHAETPIFHELYTDSALTSVDDPSAVSGTAGIDHWWRIEMQDRREVCLSQFKGHFSKTFDDVFAYDLPSEDLEYLSALLKTGKKMDEVLAFLLFAAQNPGRHHFRFLLGMLSEYKRKEILKLLKKFQKNDFISGYFTQNCHTMFDETERFLSPLLKHYCPLALRGRAS